MTTDCSPSSDIPPVLDALAVFGQADAAALSALLGDGLSARRLEVLAAHPAVRASDDGWALQPEAASVILAGLERDDLPRYRLWHQHAVQYLAERLRAGDAAAEPAFLACFERLANRLLSDDPQGFGELVRSVQDVPLATTAGRHLCRYFEGVALAKADRYAEALVVLDALLAEPDLEDHVRARSLNSRAIYCRITGRLEEAVAGFQASLEVWQRLGNRLREGMALHNLGILAYELQDYAEAEKNLRQAARCFEEAGSAQWLAAAQNELGLVYRDQGCWTEALACFQAAAAQRRAEGAQDSLGRALNNMGEVLLFQGRLEEAAAAFREALAAMSTRLYAVDAHLNLGLAWQVAGDLSKAQQAFQEALDLALHIGRRDILAQVYYRLGDVLRRQGQAAAALTRFEAAASVIEATREPLRAEELKISLLGRWQQVYEALVLHCLDLDRPDEAFIWAERARARAFADAVGKAEDGKWKMDSGSWGGEDEPPCPTSTPPSSSPISHFRAGLPEAATRLCYFTTGVLERDLPLLQTLPADSPVREHLLTPARTLLFVLTRDSLDVHECPIDPNVFASASPRHDDGSRLLAPTALRRLHACLLEPSGDALVARRLYIVPHGPLHRVPFGALTDASGQPLVRAGGPHLAYAPSATVLLRYQLSPQSRATRRRPCLAVGYDAGEGAGALRHTEAEARFVAGLTGGEAWTGPEPKKAELLRAAKGVRWLHFACHGQFNHEDPLASSLQTGAGERLTAREVLQRWQLQADLVTLSACQTGVSRILRGDEPMGLIRAFLYAGARAVLVTQWPVEDLPTFLLMRRFYSELQRGDAVDPAAALHTAQLWLRELTALEVQELVPSSLSAPSSGTDAQARPFAHPRYWAAFTLVGG